MKMLGARRGMVGLGLAWWGGWMVWINPGPAGATPLQPVSATEATQVQHELSGMQPISKAVPPQGQPLTSQARTGNYGRVALQWAQALAPELGTKGRCGFTEVGRPYRWKTRAIVPMQQVCDGRRVTGTRTRFIFDTDKSDAAARPPEKVGLLARYIALDQPDPLITREMAVQVVTNHLGILNQAELRRIDFEEELAEQPSADAFVPAYVITVERLNPYGYYDYYVSRQDGRILGRRNRVYNTNIGEVSRDYAQVLATSTTGAALPAALPETAQASFSSRLSRAIVFSESMVENHFQPSYELLHHLQGDGRLHNSYFQVTPAEGVAFFSPGNQFIVPWSGLGSTEPQFIEVQAYYGLEKVFEYFVLQGFEPPSLPSGTRQLPVLVHFGQRWNNAMYNGELIALGDGDGVNFYPLAFDNDVIAHEYSHYVVDQLHPFESRDQVGFADALHEGYADYFTVAARGYLAELENDSQVAEGIKIQGGALRDLNNQERYDRYLVYQNGTESLADGTGNYDPHLLGQVWGGALWALRRALTIQSGQESGRRIADQLAYGSLVYFEATGLYGTPSFADAQQALLRADREMFGRKNALLIAGVMEQRGFPRSPR